MGCNNSHSVVVSKPDRTIPNETKGPLTEREVSHKQHTDDYRPRSVASDSYVFTGICHSVNSRGGRSALLGGRKPDSPQEGRPPLPGGGPPREYD